MGAERWELNSLTGFSNELVFPPIVSRSPKFSSSGKLSVDWELRSSDQTPQKRWRGLGSRRAQQKERKKKRVTL